MLVRLKLELKQEKSVDCPEGSSSQIRSQNVNQDEQEEPGPHWSVLHGCRVELLLSLILL